MMIQRTATGLLAASLTLLAACTSTHEPTGLRDSRAFQMESGLPREIALGTRAGYRTPEEVLATLERAIESPSSAGLASYLGALSDPDSRIGHRPFRAEYDATVRANWEAAAGRPAPSVWDIALERALPEVLFALRPTYRYDFRWEPDPSTPIGPSPGGEDETEIRLHYVLLAIPPWATDGSVADTIAIGSCDLLLERARGRWSVFRWVDHVDPAVGVTPVDPDQRTFTWWRLESIIR